MSRRSVLKAGAVAGGVALITSTKSFPTHLLEPTAYAQTSDCLVNPGTSPPTSAFVQALPIPPIKQSVASLNPAPTKEANIAGGEAARAKHQKWSQFLPQVLYDVHTMPGTHQFHPELPPTPIWGYDGIVPGPTFIVQQGVPVLVRFHNDLPLNHFGSGGWGIEQDVIHLHNGHTGSESDGFAGDFYNPGFFKDNHYPNVLAGFTTVGGAGDPKEAMNTLWYHNHRAEFTSQNTYRGLAGFYWMFDSKDTGNENDTSPTALRLPSGYGVHDIPLILSSKTFCPDGKLFGGPNGGTAPAGGDKFCVNGAVQPFLNVNRRKYRFRILNTGPARVWTLTLTTNDSLATRPFKVICTDGNLLEQPIDSTTLVLGAAERYDFVLDFSGNSIGDHVYLRNNATMTVGGTPPNPLPPNLNNIAMEFRVVGDEADNSQVPSTLCQYPDVNLNEVVGTRIWNFDLVNGVFQINGKIFDAARSDAQIVRNTAERWILRSTLPAAGWVHPVHIHFEEFRVLSRGLPVELGGPGMLPPPPLETGRKDVIRLNGRDQVEIFMRFRDFKGKYLIHCHNMNHEDTTMMVRWDIVGDDEGDLASNNPNFIPNPNYRKGEQS
ncbi:MAG TPA: multicopper oxidase domain-containing protein [Pyrinomonadaceae bacterium]|jgi:FtsP/CotA-like multicopper oxidase with cupredoxin domain|nr:multicopper oxidase domain-containing protein [Pyrinomonadaceae bacterium]